MIAAPDPSESNHLRVTTGADQVVGPSGYTFKNHEILTPYLRSLPQQGYNGTDVGIAILDSGIYDEDAEHVDLRNITDTGRKRVVARANFVTVGGDRKDKDVFGHGTHVASVAGGSGRTSLTDGAELLHKQVNGIAFNANLVDVRVISSNGIGKVSDVIAGSLGAREQSAVQHPGRQPLARAPVQGSYLTDPLCQAVQRLANAGIVCVVAAETTERAPTDSRSTAVSSHPGTCPTSSPSGP